MLNFTGKWSLLAFALLGVAYGMSQLYTSILFVPSLVAILIMSANAWAAIAPLNYAKKKNHLQAYMGSMAMRLLALAVIFYVILAFLFTSREATISFVGAAFVAWFVFQVLEFRFFLQMQKAAADSSTPLQQVGAV